jgi:hypothetical protein
VPSPYGTGLALLAQVQSHLLAAPVIALCTGPEALAGYDGERAVVGKPFTVHGYTKSSTRQKPRQGHGLHAWIEEGHLYARGP